MSKPRSHSFRPGVLQLESRDVPSVVSVQAVGNVAFVQCNNAPSTVLVQKTVLGVAIRDVVTSQVWMFSNSQVSRVDLLGGVGDDTFTVRGNARVRMYGNGGDDTFYGGTGRDVMVGGAGDDRMYGRNGPDYIDGGVGNDYLHGGNGDDLLLGGDGNDELNGAEGADALSGDAGDDVIVSIDGTIGDAVDGGGGFDIFWIDQIGQDTDVQTGVDPNVDVVNAVTGFANSGADLTLDGDRIADPKLLPTFFPDPPDVYETFTGRPLFSSQGPTVEDFSQGALGDCYFLAALGSTTLADPNIIRSHVVDFGDGTYGVRFEDTFYRVDNDLAVDRFGDTSLVYTAFGLENSMWIAVMEKAYTHHRVPGANSFLSIEGGFSFDVFPALGLTPERIWMDPNDPLLQNPTFLIPYLELLSDTVQMIVDQRMAGTLGVSQVFFPGSQLLTSHQYIILDYELDAFSGYISTLTIRNPWGFDGPGSFPGPGSDGNFSDGILTISFDEMINILGSLEWAPVT